MKPKLKIKFSDFWGADFNPKKNYFTDVLAKRFDIIISDDPDFLVYSVYSYNFRKYKCIRILFTGENLRPNFNECDWSFSFDYDDYNGKNYRYPLYAVYGGIKKLTEPKNIEEIIKSKTKFCSFLVSNPKGKERLEFFHKLSEYKKVDSGGKILNNIGYKVKDRFEFINDYKFTLSFENSSYPGYTTEKIFQPMKVHSIPIYWGNPKVETDFNPKSFVNIHDFKNFDEAIKHIKEIDNNEDLYREYLKQPYFHNNKINEYIDENKFLARFEYIYSQKDKIEPVSTTWKNNLIDLKVITTKIKYRLFKISRWNV